MASTPEDTGPAPQPLRDGDATSEADPSDDPAQAEWERTEALDDGASADELDTATATGRDPDEIPDPDDEVPAEDLPGSGPQPESQGEDPVLADLGEEGQGDLGPGDV
ncbi:sugar ABC transporter ATPase [Microbacterium paraoxydans]|uniref:Sugar ABC transporter ATPase n=1 Tax=Microbacterium paraoxydans TaxID=199592 RepID=A0ABS5INI2_9MICO|nr:sugar ABC transporter ATPase [Microbacterium paraoxydans]MBS0024496.1 sugar ABC transporter ATPase [Microbacterium paraoxydans]